MQSEVIKSVSSLQVQLYLLTKDALSVEKQLDKSINTRVVKFSCTLGSYFESLIREGNDMTPAEC